MATTTIPELFALLESEFERQLSPELRAAGVQRCYLVASADCGIPLHATCGGATASGACWLYQPYLSRFDGFGPAAILATGDDSDDHPSLVARAVHEYAHVIIERLYLPTPQPAKIQAHRTLHMEDLASVDTRSAPMRLALHNSRFVRIALHLGHRLVRAGWNVPMTHLFDDDLRGGGWPFFHALNDAGEFEALDVLPLSRISDTPPPDAFLKACEAAGVPVPVQPASTPAAPVEFHFEGHTHAETAPCSY
jgi:hypothetical protein